MTTAGYTYEVYFDQKSGIFPDKRIDQYAVFLGFTCSPPLEVFKRNYDPKIGSTIMYIVANFFKANPGSILSYVCSPADGQERHRQISFSKWYNSSPLKEKYKLLKTTLDGTYGGVLYSLKHPEIDVIEELFTDFDAGNKPEVSEEATSYHLSVDEIEKEKSQF